MPKSYILIRQHYFGEWESAYVVAAADGDSICAIGIRKFFNIKLENRAIPYKLELVITKNPTKESVPLADIIVELCHQKLTYYTDFDDYLFRLTENYQEGYRHVTCHILPEEYPNIGKWDDYSF